MGSVREVRPDSVRDVVRANLIKLRGLRGMSQAELAQRVTELGIPMRQTTITKIERPDGPDKQGRFVRARDVDAAELVAFAVALDVSPLRLLLPDSRQDHQEAPGAGVRWVALTPTVPVDGRKAWAWAEQVEPWWDNDRPEELDPDGRRQAAWRMTRLDDGVLDYTRHRNGERIVDVSGGSYDLLDRLERLEAEVERLGGRKRPARRRASA